MSPHVTVEELDALLGEERLDGPRTAEVEAHLATCDACRAEADWLREERRLFAERRAAVAASEVGSLWPDVERRALRGGRGRGWRRAGAGAVLVGAAAAAALWLLAGDGGGPGPRRPQVTGAGRALVRGGERAGAAAGAPGADGGSPAASRASGAPTAITPITPRSHAPAAAAGAAAVTRTVTGATTVSVTTASGDVDVSAGPAGRVSAAAADPSVVVALVPRAGGGLTVRTRGPGAGQVSLRVAVPRGTHVILTGASGALAVRGVGGPVQVESQSGRVIVDGSARVRVRTAAGAISVRGAHQVDASTSNGPSVIEMDDRPDPQLRFAGGSGALDWSGTCGAGCRLQIENASGAARLRLSPRGSSFRLSFTSAAGRLRDALGLGQEGTYRGGDGVITCTSASGSLSLVPR